MIYINILYTIYHYYISYFQAPGLIIKKSPGGAYSAAGDDDINDVAAMGGVNLADEASRIGGSDIGSIIRSCKDEAFLQTGFLNQKVTRICKEKVSVCGLIRLLILITRARASSSLRKRSSTSSPTPRRRDSRRWSPSSPS